MKIVVQRFAALHALSRIIGVVPSRNTIDALKSVAVTAEDGRLTLRVTNLDMQASTEIDAEVVEAGSAALPASQLLDILKGLDCEDVRIELDGSRAKVSGGRSRMNLSALTIDHLPIVTMEGGDTTTVHAASFSEALSRVSWAIGGTRVSFALSGVSMKSTDRLQFCGATSAAFSFTHLAGSINLPDTGIILPPLFVKELEKMLKDREEDAVLSFATNKMMVRCGGVEILSRLYDGQYPDTSKAPTYARSLECHPLQVSIDALVSAVRLALVAAPGIERLIRLSLSKDTIRVSTRNMNGDESESDVECEYDGPDLTQGYAAANLISALQNIKDDVAVFEINSSNVQIVRAREGDDFVAIGLIT